jgi:hypothetical protein
MVPGGYPTVLAQQPCANGRAASSDHPITSAGECQELGRHLLICRTLQKMYVAQVHIRGEVRIGLTLPLAHTLDIQVHLVSSFAKAPDHTFCRVVVSGPKTFGGGHTTRSAKRRMDRHR